MRIYNTLTRQVEEIVPIEAGKIKMYSCGPTVYRYIHIGNLRTFTMADWLRRAFEYRGFEVLHVKNITDVGHMRQEVVDRGEDKILAQARKEGKTSLQIAQFYTDAFHEDEGKLNIEPAKIFPRATQHIPEMIAIVRGLQAKDIAYEVNGNLYFDIKRFPEYGKLSGNQLENMLAGVREGVVEDRRNPEDFPLWKVAEPGREMAWDSPWGLGFPGWHIECSAMSIKYLGEHFDLHTGGVDNIFPHHEDEIAQSEAFTGQRFVNYWVHAQHLLADGQKMAKSTGNAYTCSEIEARGFDPMALRYFYTTALYRSRLNFTFRALQAAQTSLERLRGLAYQLLLQSDRERVFADEPIEPNYWQERFLAEVENDLNMPRAMSVVWAMLRANDCDPTTRVRLLLDFDRILGFDLNGYLQSDLPRRKADSRTYLASVPAEIAVLVQERERLRERGEYARADEIRSKLEAAGRNATMRASRGRYIVLMDTSIEVKGDIWEPLAMTLADRNMGVVGPYGLVTEDLREFYESAGPDVDAIEGYLMAFRRELLSEVGWIDERFRFYRLMDIHYSFFFKTSGYRVLTTPRVVELVERHPHREWFSLSEDEQATRSKKNYDLFRERWHHGQSLLVANYRPSDLWRGHDHPHHVEGVRPHTADELPPVGAMHSHMHQHWPDHSHAHAHYHENRR